MANNRLLLKCRCCGATIMLGKTYYNEYGWYFNKCHEEKGEELAVFLDRHSLCYETHESEIDEGDLFYHPFELEYED